MANVKWRSLCRKCQELSNKCKDIHEDLEGIKKIHIHPEASEFILQT